jgi:hypothetical protein
MIFLIMVYPFLSKNITDKTKGYIRGTDYTFFIRNNSSPKGGANKKTLYLTILTETFLRLKHVVRETLIKYSFESEM